MINIYFELKTYYLSFIIPLYNSAHFGYLGNIKKINPLVLPQTCNFLLDNVFPLTFYGNKFKSEIYLQYISSTEKNTS